MKSSPVWIVAFVVFIAVFAAYGFGMFKSSTTPYMVATAISEIGSVSEKVTIMGRGNLQNQKEEVLPLIFKYGFTSSKNQLLTEKKVYNVFDYEVEFRLVEVDNAKKILVTYPLPHDACENLASFIVKSADIPFLVVKHPKYGNYSRPNQSYDWCEATDPSSLKIAI
jgi:hypothetical protein